MIEDDVLLLALREEDEIEAFADFKVSAYEFCAHYLNDDLLAE